MSRLSWTGLYGLISNLCLLRFVLCAAFLFSYYNRQTFGVTIESDFGRFMKSPLCYFLSGLGEIDMHIEAVYVPLMLGSARKG